jgi:hypothetical protein
MVTATQNIAAAWQTRAQWLARWTMYTLVNRTDMWGRYLPESKRTPATPEARARIARLGPSKAKRGQVVMDEALLTRHFNGKDPGHILGLHSVGADNTSRWLAVDLHQHPEMSPDTNRNAAMRWYEGLVQLGFSPLLIDSNGQGGYHLLIVFDQPVPAARVAAFAQSLVLESAALGLPHQPQTFPDDRAAIAGHVAGNWWRLPGRHPVSGHWSRVWGGRRWLEGADAVEMLLRTHGDPVRLLRDGIGTPVAGTPSVGPESIGSSAFGAVAASAPQTSAAPSRGNGNGNTGTHGAMAVTVSSSPFGGIAIATRSAERERALACLQILSPTRATAYHEWLRVGMALHAVDSGREMLGAWDEWSHQTPHYANGLCQQHWDTFNGDTDQKASLQDLTDWAREDAATRASEFAGPNSADGANLAGGLQDPDLQAVVIAWPTLPPALKSVVLGMIRG